MRIAFVERHRLVAIFAGVAFLLSVVSLRHAGAGPDALVTGRALVALYDRMFLVGQSFMPAVNAVLSGFPLLVASDIGVLFGLIGRSSVPAGLASLPIALWEFSLGVWFVVKGFNPSPILSSETRDNGVKRSTARAGAAQ